VLSPRKIELAVMFKLHQLAEADEEAITIAEAQELFGSEFTLSRRRVEFALEELERRHEIIRDYDRYAEDERCWKISRLGMETVDRALRVPTTFIARLAKVGDDWLNSEEAHSATLQKTKSDETKAPPVAVEVQQSTPVAALAAPSVVVNNSFSSPVSGDSATQASWFGAWGTWLAALVALAGLIWALHQAKVL
jgi:hypothetical protein